MSRRWKGRPHKCMIGQCTSEAEYVWYNPFRFRGAKWKICEPCYHMLKGEKK
jgi:hypothetical protein